MTTARTTRFVFALCVTAAAASPLAAGAADSAASPARTTYVKDRADCNAGRTAEDRATCLKEAGAAQQERKRNGLDNKGSPGANATDRCNNLPAKDKTDCLARIEGPNRAGQQTTTSGSVAGGGVIRETKTVTTGPAIVIPVPAASAPR